MGAQIEKVPFVASGVPVLSSGSPENVTKLPGGWDLDGGCQPEVDKAIGNKFGRKKWTGINLVICAIELKRKVSSLRRVTEKM